MSFNENDYSPLHLLGKTSIPRNILPTLRGSKRRSDPDVGSSVPYFATTNGKTLRITYTYENVGVVTDDQVDITFASNSYTAIIAAINAADSANLEAIDSDGFLIIRNKNPGKTHRLEIEPWTTPANDAAPIFGFQVTPFPGSRSFAGEIASTPGVRGEGNPQGTSLIGRDEDLSSGALNRSDASILQLLQELLSELERDVIVYKEVSTPLVTHPVTSGICIELDDDDLRLPIEVLGMAGSLAGGPPGKLDPFFAILSDNGSNKELGVDPTATTSLNLFQPAEVVGAFYADSSTDLDDSTSFSTWGTPDGGSIYGPTVPNKNKHAPISITSFDGNIAYCAGATFQTRFVKKNDPVQISSPTNTSPFDHSGWFAVEKVIDQTHLALRPLAPSERIPANGNRPRSINPTGLGTLRVAMGFFIPASSVWLSCNVNIEIDVRVRVAVGMSLREALAEDLALGRTGTWSHLSNLLGDHVNGASGRHSATQISGFTPGNTWADSSTVSGANLAVMINDIIGDLRETASQGGAGKIGGGAISIGGDAPNTLSAGSIYAQLSALLTTLRDNVYYPGGATWANSNSLQDLLVIQSINEIVEHLSALSLTVNTGNDGASKIGIDFHEDADGNDQWSGGTLRSVIEHLASGKSVHTGDYFTQGLEWAVGGDGSGGGSGFEPLLTNGSLICYQSQAPSGAFYNLSNLVPLPSVVTTKSYLFAGGTIRFLVETGQTSAVSCALYLIAADGSGPTAVQSFFFGTYTEGVHAIAITPSTKQYLHTYSPPANLVLIFQVNSSGTTGYTELLTADFEIRYGAP